MPIGPGKYDDLATYVRDKAKAGGVILMVFDGNQGTGFSMQAPLEVMLKLPGVLRLMADEIETGTDDLR